MGNTILGRVVLDTDKIINSVALIVQDRNYPASNSHYVTLTALYLRYNKATPNKERVNTKIWRASWQTSLPSKDFSFRLETCFVSTVVLKPPCTPPRIVDKVYTAIQETGLFSTACLDWNALTSQRWVGFKDHFTEIYVAVLVTGTGSAAQHGYTNNMMAISLHISGGSVDDDSFKTMCVGFTAHTMVFDAQAQH